MQHHEEADGQGQKPQRDGQGMALSVQGRLLGIPIEAHIARIQGKNTVSGKITLEEENLLSLMKNLSPGWETDFRQSPLYALAEGLNCRGAMVYCDDRNLLLAVQGTDFAGGVVRQQDGFLLLLYSPSREPNALLTGSGDASDDAFTLFILDLKGIVGAFDLCMLFQRGRGDRCDAVIARLASLERLFFDKSFFEQVSLPGRPEFQDVSVLVSAKADLANSAIPFFSELSEFLPQDAVITLLAGFGKQFSVLLSVSRKNSKRLASPNGARLDLRLLECSFVLGLSPALSLAGNLSFDIGSSQYLFQIACTAKASRFTLSAEYRSREKPVSIGTFFRLFQLGLTVGMQEGLLTVGGWGIVALGRFDLFALLFLRSAGSTLIPLAMGLALQRLSLSLLLDLVLPEGSIPGMEEFDFLTLEPFPLKAARMNTDVFSDLSSEGLKKIAQAFCAACQGDCGGHTVAPVSARSILVRPADNGWMLTDESSIRHYFIKKNGDIALSPQFYFCTEDALPAGSYTLCRGMFVCASLVLLGKKINFYASIDEKDGLEASVTISPIDTGWLKLAKVRKKKDRPRPPLFYNACPDGNSNAAMQYLYDMDGPHFFLRLMSNDFQLCVDASLELLNLFQVDILLTFESGKFNIYAEFFYWGLRARLVLGISYAQLNGGEFYLQLLLDLSFFQNIAHLVIVAVQKFVAAAQGAITDAQKKLAYAQSQVLNLRTQIASVNLKIDRYTDELRRLRWWQFYKVPYLLIVLGGLELEKAGIYIALGAAYAALEIAKQILEIVKKATGAVGWLIQKLAEAISSIFYLKSISLVLDAKLVSGLKASLSSCFTLFGKDYTTSVTVSLGGGDREIKDRLQETAKSQILSKTQEELKQLRERGSQALFETSRTLGTFLKESEFPYDTCAGYQTCLHDGLEFADKAAVTYGRLEALYQQDYGYADPLEERHAGQMSLNLSMAKTQWQGVFAGVQRIDCEELIEEAQRQIHGSGADSPDIRLRMDHLSEEWEELQRLQQMIQDNSGRIAGLDENFHLTREKTRRQTAQTLALSRGADRSKEDASLKYCTDIFETYAVDGNLFSHPDFYGQEEQGFTHDDVETFFINPANEPVLDQLFTQVCEQSPGGALKPWAGRAREDERRKRDARQYRIRV